MISGFLILTGCKDGNGDEKGIPPLFKSSIPANGATNVDLLTELTVTFDEVVSLSPSHGITVNNQPVTVTALFTKITINVVLELNTHYTVKIPTGAVINTKKVPLRENVEFSFTTKPAANQTIKANLVTTNPSVQAVNVYNFLKTNYGLKTVSGTVANVSWNTNEARWVYSKTGKYPALNGFDLIHLYASPANWINYEDVAVVEDWWNNKGLVTIMWHWNVPKSQGSSEYAFYTNETSFNIINAVQDGTWENDIIKADLAKAAITLKKLKDKNIPVLWRPLHEAAGTWFWWGAKGATPCKALWKMMFDYFNAEGINNLIWVWTVETNDDAWYPGDDYVDIIGRDLYNKSDVSWIGTHFGSIQTNYPDKIVSLSECGSVVNMSGQWTAGAKWSFFMPWYDYNRTVNPSSTEFNSNEHQHANAAWWTTTFNSPAVLTRDQMPDLK